MKIMIMKIIDFYKIVRMLKKNFCIIRIKALKIYAQKIKKYNFTFAIIAIMILINILNTVLSLLNGGSFFEKFLYID